MAYKRNQRFLEEITLKVYFDSNLKNHYSKSFSRNFTKKHKTVCCYRQMVVFHKKPCFLELRKKVHRTPSIPPSHLKILNKMILTHIIKAIKVFLISAKYNSECIFFILYSFYSYPCLFFFLYS